MAVITFNWSVAWPRGPRAHPQSSRQKNHTFKTPLNLPICHFILEKIIKIVATRSHLLNLKCTKFDFGWGFATNPAGEAHKPSSWVLGRFYFYKYVWLGSLTAVTCRTCNPEVTQRRRFDSAPGHCRVTTLGKLFTHMCLSPSSIIWYRLHGWDVNRHTVRYTGPVSVVSQCKNWCLAEGLRKRRSAPPYGP